MNNLINRWLTRQTSIGEVVDTNFGARRVLASTQGPTSEIEKLRLFLSHHFDDADLLITGAVSTGDLSGVSRDGNLQVMRQTAGDTVRLRVGLADDAATHHDDVHLIRALESELAMLRANINRLIRRTWCTTKRVDRLEAHLRVYADYHNRELLTRGNTVGKPLKK